MKSMLHEASTIIKALAKAWEESGQPREFTVNILEEGERNFFGFSKRPAIVSITYDPRRQAVKPAEKREKPIASIAQGKLQQSIKVRPEQNRQPVGQRQEFGGQVGIRPEVKQIRNKFGTFDKVQTTTEISLKSRQDTVRDEQREQHVTYDEIWTQDLVSDVKESFNELIDKVGLKVPSTFRTDRRMLTITFDQPVMDTAEEQRQFFVGLSYLLMQFLKKKHKKKFRGYHLVLSSNSHATSDKSTPSSSY